jgi:Tfp pilus assembly protein PilX
MGKSKRDSRGFTLIAALLLTILLSGVAVGLLYMVTNEARMGGNDLEGNMAYYGAEAGIENLTAQLSQLYQSSTTPDANAVNALWQNNANLPTAISGSNITYMNYQQKITWPLSDAKGNPAGTWDVVGSGPNQGMTATVIPFNLQVTATRAASTGAVAANTPTAATGASVNMTRTVEVALLPAFEFGIFCDGDCDYFAGPPFNFGGRVHTNGNLFLAANAGPLTFTDKIAAVGQVVTDQLENGNKTAPGNYGGSVYIPTQAGGCPAAPGSGPVAGTCVALPSGSWKGGFPPNTGAADGTWKGNTTQFNGYIRNGLTGATKLQLPFVNSGNKVGAIDIIRKPTPGDTTLLANSRLYTEAAIRILLADTEGDLYPGEVRADPAQDIQLGTPFNGGNAFVNVPNPATGNGVAAGNMYFATALKGTAANNWTTTPPTGCTATLASWPLFGEVTTANKCQGAWLRVEYWNGTNWVGVTTEWLGYGFGRGYNAPPTHPYNSSTAVAPYCQNYPNVPAAQCQNGISPAILILQQLQQSVATSSATGAAATANNWIPINFYDAREGEPRDTRPNGDNGLNCSPNGVMNAVELDAGNLWLWLQGKVSPYSILATGPKVSTTNQNGSVENGYILYFADHRGMIPDPHPLTTFYNNFSGMSGLNDTINSGSTVGVPDNKLEAIGTYYTFSPEDTAQKANGFLDNWGQANLGAGFAIAAGSMGQPYYISGSVTTNAIQCESYTFPAVTPVGNVPTAEWNLVTGPRHVLRLVDGGMDTLGNSYLPPTGAATLPNGQVLAGTGGFTVASEEPVYVYGDYNTGYKDPFWPSENVTTTPHSAAAIIADAVTLLSNPPATSAVYQTPTTNTGWTDLESFRYPANPVTNRPSNTSYYRTAIAAGKSIPFPQPAWGGPDMGTDGGMHNFLRYLENRGANGATVNYAGSMISMYYSQYDTGIFKCCNAVYGAPQRNYFFDSQFQVPSNLPPGTPMFQDVVSLSYHENFTPQ